MFPRFFSHNSTSEGWRIALVDVPMHQTLAQSAEALYDQSHRSQLTRSELIIVRLPIDRPFDSEAITEWLERDSHGYELLLRRAGNSNLRLLYTDDYSTRLSDNLNRSVADKPLISPNRFLTQLRHAELYSMIDNSSAAYFGGNVFSFRTPSGRLSNFFLRVGNLQTSRQQIDAVFFWMLPTLKDCSSILSDSWSISTIAVNSARLLDRYREWTVYSSERRLKGGTYNASTPESHCRVDFFPRYFGRDPLSVRHAEEIVSRLSSSDGKILVLYSCVRTGTSGALVCAEINRLIRPEDFKFLSIFSFPNVEQDVPQETLCELGDWMQQKEKQPGIGKFESTEHDFRSVISIDPETYFPRAATDSTVRITKHVTNGSEYFKGKMFFNRYRGLGAFSLHRNSVDISNQLLRHHGVFIDVAKMFNAKDSVFRRRFRELLNRLTRCPKIIVVPRHRAGIVLADACQKHFGRRFSFSPMIVVHDDLNVNALSTSELSTIKGLDENSELLIVDDVSVTGSRLSRYQANLREIGYRGRIVYIIGVARPDDLSFWDERVVELRDRENGLAPHDIFAVEKVVLPDWGASECPWCIESRILSGMVELRDLSDYNRANLLARIDRLDAAKRSNGLVDDPLWTSDQAEHPDLTSGSLFLNDEGAVRGDTVAAVLRALQVMRSRKIRPLGGNYPVFAKLRHRDYTQAFNDDLLHFSILRGCFPNELERVGESQENERLKDVVKNLFNLSSQYKQCAMRELLICLAARKIRIPESYVTEVCAKFEGEPELELLMALLGERI